MIECNTAIPTKKGHTFIAIESLEVCMKGGMEFKAWYSCRCGNPSCDEELHPATIVQVSHSKKRVRAPVKVSYTGYDDEHDAWVGLDKVKVSS